MFVIDGGMRGEVGKDPSPQIKLKQSTVRGSVENRILLTGA